MYNEERSSHDHAITAWQLVKSLSHVQDKFLKNEEIRLKEGKERSRVRKFARL